MFFKIDVLKKFGKFHRKTLVFEGLKTWNFIKNRLQHRYFPVKFAKFLRTLFFIGQIGWLLLNKPRISLWFIVWRSDALII